MPTFSPSRRAASAAPEAVVPAGLAIVGASQLVRGGLLHLLTGLSGITVTHQLTSLAELGARSPVPLAVIDLHGLSTTDLNADYWARLPHATRAVVLCSVVDPPDLPTAVRGGVHAVLTREATTDEIEVALRVTRQGGLYVAAELFTAVIEIPGPRPRTLTDREIEALSWIAKGLTHSQTSRRMGLSEATVSTYVKRIRHKLNAGNKAELTRRAIQLGYVQAR